MFMTVRNILISTFCAAVGLLQADRCGYANPNGSSGPRSVKFIIMGDAGTGDEGQYRVAKAIQEICSKHGCQFAVSAGDNIYDFGVRSVTDPQFTTKFEAPYADLDFPFFMVLGNHDQSGLFPGSGVYPEYGDFQVEYTSRSAKWRMPGRYYSFVVPEQFEDPHKSSSRRPVAEFFAIDTNPLAPQNLPRFHWYRPGQRYDHDQRMWLKEAIGRSRARWKIGAGHHPYRNNGKHGNAGDFFGLGLGTGAELKKMYEEEICGKVDILISGHDHSLQWLKPSKACGEKPEFIISGAAAKSEPPLLPLNRSALLSARWQNFNSLGFFWVEATEDRLKILAYTLDSKGGVSKAYEGSLAGGLLQSK